MSVAPTTKRKEKERSFIWWLAKRTALTVQN
jgi:hypothetical protein